jgi:hyperosmotically inducible periplasmic protein
MSIKSVCTLLLLGALFGPLPAAAGDMTTETAGQYLDDATITTKVKAAFAADRVVKARDISVHTDHGIVTLTGVVDSKVESDQATKLAAEVKAVEAVRNNLIILTR